MSACFARLPASWVYAASSSSRPQGFFLSHRSFSTMKNCSGDTSSRSTHALRPLCTHHSLQITVSTLPLKCEISERSLRCFFSSFCLWDWINEIPVFKVTINRFSLGLCYQPDSTLVEFICFILLSVVRDCFFKF